MSQHPHIPQRNSHLSSLLQFSENHNLVRADPDYLQRKFNRFQLSTIVTKGSILDVGKGPNLAKLIFVWQKKNPSNSIQKLFMMETALHGNCKIIFTIAGSSLLLSSSFLGQQLSQRAPDLPLITIFGKVIIHLGQATAI